MLFRLFILAGIAIFGLSLACSPAMAEEPEAKSSKAAIEKAEEAVIVPLPTNTRRGRLSTRDRWRGTPYLRTADESVRNQALDLALPPANPAFHFGANLQGGLFATEETLVRAEALDKMLPPANVLAPLTTLTGTGF